MDIKTIVEFEAHDDHFLPWDFALDATNTVVGKSPYTGQVVIGFAPKGDTEALPVFIGRDGWMDKAVGLVPVMADKGEWYQLTSHVVRRVRPFGATDGE